MYCIQFFLGFSDLKSDDSGDEDENSRKKNKENRHDDSEGVTTIPTLKPYQYSARNPKLDVEELDMDDSKKSLISQEISKFRETHKVSLITTHIKLLLHLRSPIPRNNDPIVAIEALFSFRKCRDLLLYWVGI